MKYEEGEEVMAWVVIPPIKDQPQQWYFTSPDADQYRNIMYMNPRHKAWFTRCYVDIMCKNGDRIGMRLRDYMRDPMRQELFRDYVHEQLHINAKCKRLGRPLTLDEINYRRTYRPCFTKCKHTFTLNKFMKQIQTMSATTATTN